MSTNRAAADLLEQHMEPIISEWEVQARHDLEASGKASTLVLRDHVEAVINDLRGHLMEAPAGETKFEKSRFATAAIEVSEKHGRERAGTDSYNEEQIMWEAVLLRRIIIDHLFKHHLSDALLTEQITRFFENSSWAAVISFSESIKSTHKQIIFSLVHDIRNPLAAIDGAIRLLFRARNREDPNEIYKMVQHNVHRIDAILREVLDFASIEAGKGLLFKFQLCDFSVDLKTLCRETNGVYGSRFAYKNGSPDRPINAVLDSGLLIRLLENLISNAFKHGAPDGTVTLSVDDRADHLSLSVHNFGQPIPEERQEEIFKYLSTTRGGNVEGKGWGIGLSLAKVTAEGHSGNLHLESSKEGGTIFTLRVPKFAFKHGETRTVLVQ